MSFMGILTSLLGVLKGWFDKKNFEGKLNNTVEMQERKASQELVTGKDEAEKLIKKIENGTEEEKNAALEEIRKQVAS